MSDRLPQGSFELWFQFNLIGSTHTSFSSLGWVYTPAELPVTAFMAAFLLSASESMASGINNSWTCGPGYALIGSDDPEPTRIDGTGDADGGIGGNAATPNCAYLYRKRTALGGRRGRGRMYIPGVTEDEVDNNGLVSNTQIGVLEDVITAITGEAETFRVAEGLDFVAAALMHNLLRDPDPPHDPIPGTGLPPTPLTSLGPETFIATQRRRMPRP